MWLIRKLLLVLLVCAIIVTTEEKLFEHNSSYNGSMSPIHNVLVKILKFCERDYDNILTLVDSNDANLKWLNEVQIDVSTVIHKNLSLNIHHFVDMKKFDAYVLVLQSLKSIGNILDYLSKNTKWSDVLIPIYILSPIACNDYVLQFTFKTIRFYELVAPYLLCADVNQEIKLYTYNFFTDRAPNQWKRVVDKNQTQNWTIYQRNYTEGDICQELNFKRTEHLNGYKLIIAYPSVFVNSSYVGKYFDQSIISNNPKFFYMDAKLAIRALFRALDVNCSIFFHALQSSSKKYSGSLAAFHHDVLMNSSFDIFFTPHIPKINTISPALRMSYPTSWTEYGIATYHKGYQTFAEKIRDFYGTWTILFTLFIILVTSIVIWFTENKKLPFTIFEIIRLIIGQGLLTRMNTLSLKIFFSMIFIYFLVIQATFNGHLAKFLTKPQLRPHADTFEDLQDLGYTEVWNMSAVLHHLFNSSKNSATMSNLIRTCVSYIIRNNTSAACIGDHIHLRLHSYKEKNLYVSKKPFGPLYSHFVIRRNSPLWNRIHLFFIWIEDLGIGKFISNTWKFPIPRDVRVASERSDDDFQPIVLENFMFIYIVLAIGLERWRDSVLGAPRRLLTTLGNLSRDSSPQPVPKDEPLPSLPVPFLETTMQKYLKQVEAICPNHLDRSRTLVNSFLAGPGPKLQQYLLERRQKMANWATEWWLDDMYLSIPLALPININPGLAARPKKFSNQQEAAIFLARFLMELLNYQETLDRKELEVELVKSRDGKVQPLCMAQHYQVLRIYRKPGEIKDEQVILDRTTSGDHIIVAHYNQFYSIPVRASDRGRITEMEMIQQLLKIMETPADPRTPPVGILTTSSRPVWARARKELLKNEQNRHNLELLERCLCIVCIDEDVLPVTFNESYKKNDCWINDRDYANVLHHCLHGGGSRYHGANRWFDKTLNVILGKDGMWGMTYEHSSGEASAICNAFETLTDNVDAMQPPDESLVPSHLPSPEKLEWKLSDKSLNDIREAIATFDSSVEDLDLCILWFDDYSKEFVKACKISPDAYVQLALQLTYFRLHGHLAATYESAGIRRFALGRVDVIRAASPETLAWVKAMCQGDPELQNDTQEEGTKRVQFTIYSEQQIKELFDLAVQRQTNEIADNIHGLGIDNHLMGLRYAAKEIGESMPDLFNDESFEIVHHFSLSTSQVTTKNDAVIGYGPVVPDGYGCCYNLRKNAIVLSISAFHSDGRTSARKFAQTLESSLRDMAEMLKNAQNRR